MRNRLATLIWVSFVIFVSAVSANAEGQKLPVGAAEAEPVGSGAAEAAGEVSDPLGAVVSWPEGLAEVQELLEAGRAKQAYKKASQWVQANKDSEVLDLGLYLQAKAQYDRKLYYQSFLLYEELLDHWGASAMFESVLHHQLDIAHLFLSGAKRKLWGFLPVSARTEGLEILDRVVERWPGSELAAQALMLQADYYYDRGRFIEAQMTHQIVVDHYTKSQYYEQALLRNAESTHGQYKGPLYDSSCLTEARLRYEQYRSRYPERANELGIAQRVAGIRRQEAEKHRKIANFYRRTHRDTASRYYIDYIQSHWPETEWAEEN